MISSLQSTERVNRSRRDRSAHPMSAQIPSACFTPVAKRVERDRCRVALTLLQSQTLLRQHPPCEGARQLQRPILVANNHKSLEA